MVERSVYVSSLVGGATAGLFVDVSLFPLDTIKTRLQASEGFQKAGGFKGIYKGLGPQVIGSAPTAALFFVTYDCFKAIATPYVCPDFLPLVHMAAASLGETVACLIRVPVEIIKQRRQTTNRTVFQIFKFAYRTEGLKGLYRGFGSTVLREIPFSFIQFPIFEYLKSTWKSTLRNGKDISSLEVSVCGAIAGGISAAATTPLDVVKTRIMLADKSTVGAAQLNTYSMLKMIYRQNGIQGLFLGFVPRVLWITIGGAIFFGAYDFSKNLTLQYFLSQ